MYICPPKPYSNYLDCLGSLEYSSTFPWRPLIGFLFQYGDNKVLETTNIQGPRLVTQLRFSNLWGLVYGLSYRGLFHFQ